MDLDLGGMAQTADSGSDGSGEDRRDDEEEQRHDDNDNGGGAQGDFDDQGGFGGTQASSQPGAHGGDGSEHEADGNAEDYDDMEVGGHEPVDGPRMVDDIDDFMDDDNGGDGLGRQADSDDEDGDHADSDDAPLMTDANAAPVEAEKKSDTTSKPDSEEEALLLVWERAPTRLRVFSVVDPAVCETMAQPGNWATVTRIYQVLYLIVVLANSTMLVLSTFPQWADATWITSTIVGSQALFAIDFVIRVATVPSKEFLPMIVVDFLSLVAAIVCFTSKTNYGLPYETVYLALLRTLRLFLFTKLFVRTETFRDINLALRTIEESFKSLMIFVVVMGVALSMFSTFIFIAERGRFDTISQLWYRPCKEFTCVGETLSPFQSIPDALWLVIQAMTTVGYGDVVPTTTLGRTIAGASIILGVFVIAFPSMVLIGNLDATRRDFFEREQVEALNRAYGIGRDGKRIKEDGEEDAEVEEMGASASGNGGGLLGKTMTFADALQATMAAGELKELRANDDILFATLPGLRLDSTSSSVNSRIAGKRFSFMGSASRLITHVGRGEYTYQPLFQVLCDPNDRLPVVSGVQLCPGAKADHYLARLTLVLDDLGAQQTATSAIGEQSPGAFAHASLVYGLEVTMKTALRGVRMRRRGDIGCVSDASIPLILELSPSAAGAGDIHAFVQTVRKQLSSSKLRCYYSTDPVTSAIWVQNIPITSIMLASTPFVVDLQDIAVNVALASLWPEARRRKASPFATTRRNLAFVTTRHMESLVYPVFKKVVDGDESIIRNAGEFSQSLVNMITLHCRCVRKMDLPPSIHRAIYHNESVGMHEELYEVDVDYFRTVDWPLGNATVEFSERPRKVELIVNVSDASKFEQPEITDIEVFRRVGSESAVIPRQPSFSSTTGSRTGLL